MSEIGKTYQGNSIPVMEVNSNSSNQAKKSLIFTGAHHARELTSISMALNFLLRTIYGHFINDTETLALLNSTNLYFIPVINIDGFKLISDLFN